MIRRFNPAAMKAARAGAAMDFVQLAHRCGVTGRTVSNWEAGRHDPRVNHFLVLCDALGVPLDSLLTDRPADRDAP